MEKGKRWENTIDIFSPLYYNNCRDRPAGCSGYEVNAGNANSEWKAFCSSRINKLREDRGISCGGGKLKGGGKSP